MAGNRSVASRALIALGAAAVLFGQLGCYVLNPIPGTSIPPLGSRVAVDITDAGRVALGSLMGSEIRQIEGRLMRNDAAEIELAVSAVRMLRGGEQVWSGERIRVRKEHVSTYYEKQLDKGRTVAASAVGVGLVAVFVGKGIVGAIAGENDKTPKDTALSVRRPAARPLVRP